MVSAIREPPPLLASPPSKQPEFADIKGQLESLKSTTVFPDSLKGKKIILATESLGPVNGVSRTTGQLIDYLRENGANVAVVAPIYKKAIIPGRTRAKNPEIRLHGYPLPYNPDLTVAYPFRLDRLYLRTFVPDIVYLASPASVGFQFLVQLRQLQPENSPVVMLNFQTDLSSYSNILFRYPWNDYAVWLLRVVQGFLFNARAVHTIFYPSTFVETYLAQAGAPADKMVKLGRGVDCTMFNPSKRSEDYRRQIAPNGEIILVSVARLAPEKGFGFLADVARKLKARGLKFKLLVVGGNKNPTVVKEVHRYYDDVSASVVFTGFLTGEDLARAYAAADIFLHCSITETFGLVVLESMASGVPVIARDEGGPSDIIQHGTSGYLIGPSDLDAFVVQTEQVATDVQLRNALAMAARAQALETTWEKINNEVAWRCAQALEERKPKPAAASSRSLTASSSARLDAAAAFARQHPIWRPDFMGAGWVRFLRGVVSAVRMEAAIGIVFVFWNIAVIPLLVLGFMHR